MENIIEIRGLKKHFGQLEVLNDIRFGVAQGEVICLIGASGSGKSTLLRCINLLETPDAGEILVHGQDILRGRMDVNRYRARVGMVFQSFNLFGNMDVLKNCMAGQVHVLKRSKEEARQKALTLLEKVGMREFAGASPNQLSGGQKQRVAFARALAPNPQLLLLDEPFAAIDAKVRRELRGWLKDMIARVGITSIFVTHDQEEAMEVADVIILMNRGGIEQMGSAGEICGNPRTDFVRDFIDAGRYEDMKL